MLSDGIHFSGPSLIINKHTFWCLCTFKVSPDCQNPIITTEHEIWAETDAKLWVWLIYLGYLRSGVLCFDYNEQAFTTELTHKWRNTLYLLLLYLLMNLYY